MTTSARETVSQTLAELFGQKDIAAVDRHFDPQCVQHGPTAREDLAGLRTWAEALIAMPGFAITSHRMLADGDLVAVHGSYAGIGQTPVVAFDIFRVAGGLIAEHWYGSGAATPPNPSGHSQVDGPTEILDHALTADNRALVESFVADILIGGQYDRLPDYIDGDHYVQHNSHIADGLSGLGEAIAAMAAQGITMVYHARHRTVAEGNFVLTQSEGTFGGEPTAYFDLFRVEGGRIVEHWDIMQPIGPAGAIPAQ